MTYTGRDSSSEEFDRIGELCAVLADARRRQVLHHLYTSEDETATVEDLADSLVTLDCCSSDSDHVSLRLHHVTLPKLDDAGLVEYDPRSNCVRYRETQTLERLPRRISGIGEAT
ncbi:DUF7344 domain-containing protein [Halorussus halophilus]|uniref:DUF7344 domain-containing protein n=1 Tax=Halorussus halophilus TaxID=2650975 RepID=UPI0013017D52|nr:hypothetical protein [Halorussus halophilus]